MPSANGRRVSRLIRGLNAWLLVILILAAGAGGVSSSLGQGLLGSSTSTLPAYYVFEYGDYAPWPSNTDCPSCPQPCEPTPNEGGCQSNDGDDACEQTEQGWKFYKPGPATCNGCLPGTETYPCAGQTPVSGGYFGWTHPRYHGRLPLTPHYYTANSVWLQSHYQFNGDSQHTTFSVSGPVRSLDPYSFDIEVQLNNFQDQDLIMELTIDAPSHLFISVKGMGSIQEVALLNSEDCGCLGQWAFILPAVHTANTGLHITVADPSQMQQSYILTGDISPLQAA